MKLLDLAPGPRWHSDAACAAEDPADFTVRPTKKALEVCGRCAVVVACREFAREAGEEFGIWGGRNLGAAS